jgi:CheY-like chemotaxis protein
MDTTKFCYPLVMLIDDCSTDNFVNNRMLQHYKFAERALIFTSSRKALEEMKAMANAAPGTVQIPSYIFLDLNMPMLNGHQFIAEFAKLPETIRSQCRIIVLSSSMDPADMLTAIRNKDVVAYISKPIIKSNLDELSGKLGPAKVAA